ncbi:MAG: universal stress protein [Candidatus Thorarchaeota archaeon]
MSFLSSNEWAMPTLKRILIPLQGFPAEKTSLDLGFSLAENSKAMVSLLHCKERIRRSKKSLLTQLEKQANSLSKHLDVSYDIEFVKRVRASDAILKSSNDNCDLVVLSAAHSSDHKQLLGSTARRVARKSEIPVLIIASWQDELKEYKEPLLRKILLPIRHTKKDLAALRLAAVLKQSSAGKDAELIALNLTHFSQVEMKSGMDAPEIKLQRELFMDDISIFSEQSGLKVTPKHVAAKDICEAAVEIAAEEDVDLIILGAQKKPGRFRNTLGQVSYKIAKESKSPVVITFIP